MLRNEALQHRNQVVIANQLLTIAVNIGSLDVAIGIHHQLIGKAMTLAVQLAVLIRVNHVFKIVDHGLGNHHRLFALGQINGFCSKGGISIQANVAVDEAVKIHQDIISGIQLVQNPAEFLYRYEVLVVEACILTGHILVTGAGSIGHQHMEGEVGNG